MKVGELKKLIANLPANAEVMVKDTFLEKTAGIESISTAGLKGKEIIRKINNGKVNVENIDGNNYKTLILYI